MSNFTSSQYRKLARQSLGRYDAMAKDQRENGVYYGYKAWDYHQHWAKYRQYIRKIQKLEIGQALSNEIKIAIGNRLNPNYIRVLRFAEKFIKDNDCEGIPDMIETWMKRIGNSPHQTAWEGWIEALNFIESAYDKRTQRITIEAQS